MSPEDIIGLSSEQLVSVSDDVLLASYREVDAIVKIDGDFGNCPEVAKGEKALEILGTELYRRYPPSPDE